MGETFDDIIGGLFDIYKAKETAKIDARLETSRAQAVALETSAYLALQKQQQANAQTQAAGVPAWVTPLAIAGVGIAVLWMMR